MTDETKTPQRVLVQLEGDTLGMVAELMVPVTHSARASGYPDPSPADVVELSIRLMHANVFARAGDGLTDAERESRTATAH